MTVSHYDDGRGVEFLAEDHAYGFLSQCQIFMPKARYDN